MAAVVNEFFGIIGVSIIPPSNMAELIPYLLSVMLGFFLVSAVFFVIGRIVEFLFSFRMR